MAVSCKLCINILIWIKIQHQIQCHYHHQLRPSYSTQRPCMNLNKNRGNWARFFKIFSMYSLASCRQTECMVMIRILSWETNSCKYLSDRSKKSSGRPTHVGAMYSQSVFLACWKVAIYSAQIFLGENGGGHKNIFVKIHRQNIYIHVWSVISHSWGREGVYMHGYERLSIYRRWTECNI